VELRELANGRFELTFRPTLQAYTADETTPISYPERMTRASQIWLRFPVSGVSVDDTEAYASWMNSSRRLPGARLCDEREWERAARGADGRTYPSGDQLEPDDANRDVTYGRRPLAFGPDEVGSHPGSRSPYGLDDLAGNVWEWVRSVARDDEAVYRGGSWYQGDLSSRSTNREVGERTMRHPLHGFRLCADVKLE
jgi:formylglycine-generating enzyme required for sulfatase activity